MRIKIFPLGFSNRTISLNQSLLLAGLFFIHSLVSAGEISSHRDKKTEAVALSHSDSFHLEVTQAPLKQILKIIESQTGVQLHVSQMPSKLVTATCVGTALEVLKCVLGREVNLIYQYADRSFAGSPNPSTSLTDIWVLNLTPSGHRLSRDTQNQVLCSAAKNLNKAILDEQQVSAEEQAEKLFTLVRSTNPRQRQEALTRLALAEQIDDESAREILEEALQDQNARVRAQAVSGLVRRQSPAIDSILREALQDSNVGVRLMAVSNAGENIYLLESALNDPSRIVRDLASMKLEQVSKMNSVGNR